MAAVLAGVVAVVMLQLGCGVRRDFGDLHVGGNSGFPGMSGFPDGGLPSGGFPVAPGGDPSGGFPRAPGMPSVGDALHCAAKMEKLCCVQTPPNGQVSRAAACKAIHYCLAAVGERPLGPVPPCGQAPLMGDAAKCKDSDETLRAQMKRQLEICQKKLVPLYDLQHSLVQCDTGLRRRKKALERRRAQVQATQAEAQECEEEARASDDKWSGSIEKDDFCPKLERAALRAAAEKLSLVVAECVALQVPKIEVDIPEIDIKDPDFSSRMGSVYSHFSVPDFSRFDGSAVIPGGGSALNAPSSGSKPEKITLETREANVEAEVQRCKGWEQKQQGSRQQLERAALESQKAKEEACKEKSLPEEGAFSPAETVIAAVRALARNPLYASCGEVSGAADAFVSLLEQC